MAVDDQRLTGEAFWELYANKPYELVRGRAVEVPSVDDSHGAMCEGVAGELGAFVDEHDLGDVVIDTGFELSADTICGPDVAFMSQQKLATVTESDMYLPFAPDLAVEVVSPDDTAVAVQDKVNLYLEAGTRLVWVVYPELQRVVVHRANRTSITVKRDGLLDGEDVLPGLKIAVTDVFPQAPASTVEER
ncbi:MAG: Uma2 family endonuclease [Anaerolineae bacterium]|nr:Uma2 family endonuclease [Anaerolineae bacterium]